MYGQLQAIIHLPDHTSLAFIFGKEVMISLCSLHPDCSALPLSVSFEGEQDSNLHDSVALPTELSYSDLRRGVEPPTYSCRSVSVAMAYSWLLPLHQGASLKHTSGSPLTASLPSDQEALAAYRLSPVSH